MLTFIFGVLAFILFIIVMWHRDEIRLVRQSQQTTFDAHKILLNTIDAGTMPLAIIASRGWKIECHAVYADDADPTELTRKWTVNGETAVSLIEAYNKACRVWDARSHNSEE